MGLFRHGSLQRELYQRVSGEPSRESSARTESSFSSKAEGQPCAAESTSGPLARARKARKKPHAKGDAGAKQPADMVLGDEAGIFKNTNLQRRLQERVSFEEAKRLLDARLRRTGLFTKTLPIGRCCLIAWAMRYCLLYALCLDKLSEYTHISSFPRAVRVIALHLDLRNVRARFAVCLQMSTLVVALAAA
eukprot:6180547-Pleurochrysis_carterae.AAC.4